MQTKEGGCSVFETQEGKEPESQVVLKINLRDVWFLLLQKVRSE